MKFIKDLGGKDYPFVDDNPIKQWTIFRAIYYGRWARAIFWVIVLICFFTGWWNGVRMNVELLEDLLFFILIGWAFVKYPVIYRFRLYSEGAICHSGFWEPRLGIKLAKYLLGFMMLALLVFTIYAGSILMLFGGVGITLFAGLAVLSREPEELSCRETKWCFHDLIIIDRHQKLVVVGHKDKRWDGFEFPVRKKDIEPLVALLRSLMPQAEVIELSWHWEAGLGSKKEFKF